MLWEEYAQIHPDGYGRTQFCEIYRQWTRRLRPSMRQVHRAGEKTFIDYSGKRPSLVDRRTGELRRVELFVAVLLWVPDQLRGGSGHPPFGQSVIVTRRQAAHDRLRDAAYHWARVAAQRDPVRHDKYRRYAPAVTDTHAPCVRWAIACVMLRSGACFDPHRVEITAT